MILDADESVSLEHAVSIAFPSIESYGWIDFRTLSK